MIIVERSQALSPGADLWIVGRFEDSEWTGVLDWRTGFQLYKSVNQGLRSRDAKLSEILVNSDIPDFHYPSKHHFHLYPAELTFPCKWILLINESDSSPERWLNLAYSRWLSLQKPSLRILCPRGIQEDWLASNWQNLSDDRSHQLIPSLVS